MTGVWMVLRSNVSWESAVTSDHMAMPSSPVLRMKLSDAVEFVTPVWKLMPSASWSTITLAEMVRFVIGPSSQMPAFVCWM